MVIVGALHDSTKNDTPTVVRGGVDGTPSQSFWYVAVFLNDFAFS